MDIVTLSGALGFDSKLDYGSAVTFIGNNPICGTWYVNMAHGSITLGITDGEGNTVYAIVTNEDHSLSGLEASILIKKFFSKVKRAVKNGNRMNRDRFSWINGREITMLWTQKKKDN